MRVAWLVMVAFAAPAHADTCPVTRVKAKAVKLESARDLKAAEKRLLAGASMPEGAYFELTGSSDAFSVPIRGAFEEGGDSSYWNDNAVFVLAKRVVMARNLAANASVLTVDCPQALQEAVLGARLVETAKHRHIGIARVRRMNVKGATTLSAVPVPANYKCPGTTTYRIEDHYFDLDRMRELLVLAQTYEGPIYKVHAPPATVLADLQVTDAGVTIDSCNAIRWRP